MSLLVKRTKEEIDWEPFPNYKLYIQVAYKEKDLAKCLGAKWDADSKCWYFTDFKVHNFKPLRIVSEHMPDKRMGEMLEACMDKYTECIKMCNSYKKFSKSKSIDDI